MLGESLAQASPQTKYPIRGHPWESRCCAVPEIVCATCRRKLLGPQYIKTALRGWGRRVQGPYALPFVRAQGANFRPDFFDRVAISMLDFCNFCGHFVLRATKRRKPRPKQVPGSRETQLCHSLFLFDFGAPSSILY